MYFLLTSMDQYCICYSTCMYFCYCTHGCVCQLVIKENHADDDDDDDDFIYMYNVYCNDQSHAVHFICSSLASHSLAYTTEQNTEQSRQKAIAVDCIWNTKLRI